MRSAASAEAMDSGARARLGPVLAPRLRSRWRDDCSTKGSSSLAPGDPAIPVGLGDSLGQTALSDAFALVTDGACMRRLKSAAGLVVIARRVRATSCRWLIRLAAAFAGEGGL